MFESAAILLIAKAIARMGAATRAVGGTIGWRHLTSGSTWIVDLDAPGGKWLEAPGGCSHEVLISGTDGGFAAVLTGGRAMRQSLLHGELTVAGDLARLGRLAQHLSRGGSPFAHRLRQTAAHHLDRHQKVSP